MSCYDKIQQYKNETFFIVEATDFEKHILWEKWHKEVTWEQLSPGSLFIAGELDKFDVCFAASWQRINGKTILFYHPTSVVVDHRKIDNWLMTELPQIKAVTNGGLVPRRTDASNFHICVHEINRCAPSQPTSPKSTDSSKEASPEVKSS